jgi:predicted alpha/beta superfamily hydrolase
MHYTKEVRWISSLQREGILYIGLPDEYDLSPQRYPVLYMHDGHNVFDVNDSYGHTIWDIVSAFKKNKKLPPCIVVALSCAMEGNRRIEEYNVFPSSLPRTQETIAGRGKEYLSYLLKELKPEVDHTYRTISDANHTLMMGSSMGGVITLEAYCLFPKLIGRIGCVSNAFYTSLPQLKKLVQQTSFKTINKIYLDTGDQEVGLDDVEGYITSNQMIADLIRKKTSNEQFQFKIIRGGKHHETSWKKRLPAILKFLLTGL